jgi:hypothetical protein
LHVDFVEQCKRIVGDDADLTKQVHTALDKIAADPASGKALRHAPQRLKGKIYRLHVGGRQGRRLLYVYIHNDACAIPYYLSEVERSKFDYEDVEWGKIAEPFYDDYVNKRYDRFRNYQA